MFLGIQPGTSNPTCCCPQWSMVYEKDGVSSHYIYIFPPKPHDLVLWFSSSPLLLDLLHGYYLLPWSCGSGQPLFSSFKDSSKGRMLLYQEVAFGSENGSCLLQPFCPEPLGSPWETEFLLGPLFSCVSYFKTHCHLTVIAFIGCLPRSHLSL